MIDRIITSVDVASLSPHCASRMMMSTITMPVTVSMTVMCQLAVRRAWFPGSVDLHQSQKPVSAAPSDTIAPAMITCVPEMKKSRPTVESLPAIREITSNTATRTYAPTGTSVSGGWEGFPAHPRRPLNCLPLNVTPGPIENLRLIVAPFSRPGPDSHTRAVDLAGTVRGDGC